MELKELIERIRQRKEAVENNGPLLPAIADIREHLRAEELIGESAKTTDDLRAIEVELFGKKGLVSILRKKIPQEAPAPNQSISSGSCRSSCSGACRGER